MENWKVIWPSSQNTFLLKFILKIHGTVIQITMAFSDPTRQATIPYYAISQLATHLPYLINKNQ